MQIVFGGAFNGKRQFVKQQLKVEECSWYEGQCPESISKPAVIAGLEKWVKLQLQNEVSEENIMQHIKKVSQQAASSEQIWILTDMNRGIVPIDPIEREMRDVIGRIYQHLFAEAQQITRIWYGIPQIIKGADHCENLYKNR
ncbi:bifunctional adenosylcobinamide kinase/adenosylcobinamide-phosphate guanylyltransferase [Planococcus sp. CAU13]|uniref:bifunctional adenosylcobinamide kinase/adenosylcobinamide-phosphate guanylyltransferase n=1 Tax=Planococcus sp. CAU13 TaxID=1541197 RepID=UPI00052FFA99|nr:bifunctional adenosylcobinamide kinase/adenosylcobinamide-phosphate guanylyltransferase [Planococcus sp. CAU13]